MDDRLFALSLLTDRELAEALQAEQDLFQAPALQRQNKFQTSLKNPSMGLPQPVIIPAVIIPTQIPSPRLGSSNPTTPKKVLGSDQTIERPLHLSPSTPREKTLQKKRGTVWTGDQDSSVLNWSNQKMEDLSPGIFDRFSHITDLLVQKTFSTLISKLERNLLVDLPFGIFDNLTRLSKLHLSSNKITRLPASIFHNLTKLSKLFLHGNCIATFPPDLFQNSNQLSELWIGRQKFQDYQLRTLDLSPTMFQHIPLLSKLDIRENNIKLSKGFFDPLTQLQELILCECGISEIPTGLFDKLPQLSRLDLGKNHIVRPDPGVFQKLLHLTSLDIRDNKIKDLPIGIFDRLGQLTSLNLSGNNELTEIHLGLFDRLTLLKSLQMDPIPFGERLCGPQHFFGTPVVPLNIWNEFAIHELLKVRLFDGSWDRECMPLEGAVIIPFNIQYLIENGFWDQTLKFNIRSYTRCFSFKESEDDEITEPLLILVDKETSFEIPKAVLQHPLIFLVFHDHNPMADQIFDAVQKSAQFMIISRPEWSADNFESAFNEAKERVAAKAWGSTRPSDTMSLIVLGHGAAGKTALISVLARNRPESSPSTIGFETGSFSVGRKTFFYSDFAGQVEYLSIHHHFLARTVDAVLLVVDGTLHAEKFESQMKHWLLLLQDWTGKTFHVLTVISKIDLILDLELKKPKFEEVFRHLQGQFPDFTFEIFFVSNTTMIGIQNLKECLSRQSSSLKTVTGSPKVNINPDLPSIIPFGKFVDVFEDYKILSAEGKFLWILNLIEMSVQGQILYDVTSKTCFTDLASLSKLVALFLGPSDHFHGNAGRDLFKEGIVTVGVAKKLISTRTPHDPSYILSFFKAMGICRDIDPAEAGFYGYNEEVLVFQDLLPKSDFVHMPVWPSVKDKTYMRRRCKPESCFQHPVSTDAQYLERVQRYSYIDVAGNKSVDVGKDSKRDRQEKKILVCYEAINDEKVIALRYDSFPIHLFTRFCGIIRKRGMIASGYKNFLNTLVAIDALGNMHCYFHQESSLYVVVRGYLPVLWDLQLKDVFAPKGQPKILCPICAMFGTFRLYLAGEVHFKAEIGYPDEGYPTSYTRYPWDPIDPLLEKEFVPSPGFPNLQEVVLTENDVGPKKTEFDHINKLLDGMTRAEKDTKQYGEWLEVEKIICFKNTLLEAKFRAKFLEFAAKSSKLVKNDFDEDKQDVMKAFSRYKCRIAGNEGINLVLALQGNKQEDTNRSIANGGQLRPEEKEKAGIQATDHRYFGNGIYFSQFQSYCLQYSGDTDALLLSWILMGNVFPVTESVNGPNSFKKKPLNPGYDSHYVLVRREGVLSFADVASMDRFNGDEIVIPSGEQCLSHCIVFFKKRNQGDIKFKNQKILEVPLKYRTSFQSIVSWCDYELGLKDLVQWVDTYVPGFYLEKFFNVERFEEWTKQYHIFGWSKQGFNIRIVFSVELDSIQDFTKFECLKNVLTTLTQGASKLLIMIYIENKTLSEKVLTSNIKKKSPLTPFFSKIVITNNRAKLLEFCSPSASNFILDRHLFGESVPSPSFDFRTFEVTIVKGENLLGCGSLTRKSSPYCLFGFLDSNKNRYLTYKTEAKSGNLNPVWKKKNSQRFILKALPISPFLIEVWDHDMKGDNSMGEVQFVLRDLKYDPQGNGEGKFDIQQGKAKKGKSNGYGCLYLKWKFSP